MDTNVTSLSSQAALRAALDLASDGFSVFPCAVSKAPTTAHGHLDASSDSTEVRRLWRQHPGVLVGMPTGEANGFDVLDIDGAGMPWLEAHADRLPRTLIVTTRRRGFHFYFQHQSGLRGSAGLVAAGVDVRASGNYVVNWAATGLPVDNDADIAPWPAWLITAIICKADPVKIPRGTVLPDEHLIGGLTRFVAMATEGERNNSLHWAARRMREMVGPTMSVHQATAILLDAAAKCGLPHTEADRTIRSAFRSA